MHENYFVPILLIFCRRRHSVASITLWETYNFDKYLLNQYFIRNWRAQGVYFLRVPATSHFSMYRTFIFHQECIKWFVNLQQEIFAKLTYLTWLCLMNDANHTAFNGKMPAKGLVRECPGQGQELDSKILVGPFNSGCSMILSIG